MSVADAVKRDLEKIRAVDPELADSGLAATAVKLAELLDQPDNSATSRSMCARALQEALKDLRDLTPADASKQDGIDELLNRRAKRRAGAAG